ncbi:HAD family hydrolase [Salisediminibacterium beveridgei]|uniref:HAD-superfamily hydrolase, subfamily IA, variant 1 family protein n=1 Tax=Salisediminibacterium beveridgei TaxID=632773 RepID=A0A1D7QWW4_9BACI|nr:HAD family hydrolase [Salisediminibacterium beveridgei]AOM83502.1 HAD-superfamily hydrolase, subfamily IA, variant 1 family protein [Salisediminibacterium beveridgei]
MIRIGNHTLPIDTVIFDKDGTLVDFESLWFTWLDDIHSYLTSSFSIEDPNFKDELYQALGIAGRDIDPMSPLAIGSLNDSKVIISFKLYIKGVPWDQAVELVTKSIDYANERQSKSDAIRPVQGIERVLEEMKSIGMKLGVMTADETSQAKEHLRALKLAHFFDFIIGNDQVENGKPYPDMAFLAADQYDAVLERSVMIGDTNGDMKLGKNAGMHASIGILSYAKNHGAHLEDADYKITTYDDIQIIKKTK